MAEIDRTPESEGLEVVVVGSFNPSIFHPQWFLRQGLILEEDANQAKVMAIGPEVCDINFSEIRLLCLSDRLSLSTSNISKSARIQDFLFQIFTLLPHIPVVATGINPSAHYRVGNSEHWHKIGHTLAPKELVWNELFEQPGMQSLVIKAPRKGEFPGEINVKVEPSVMVAPGIFILSNFHYAIPPDKIHVEATDQLLKFVKAEWHSACEMVHLVAAKIFEKIKPENA